jgi:endonuclease/exonuclease/phosphatase family metal-dependent hydrolase
MEEVETGSFVREPFPCEWPETIRLVSWNVNRGYRLTEIIEYLAGSSADLILMQETDLNVRRTGHRNIPREIARALQMNYVFGREFEELGQGHRGIPAFHGQTTLSRFPLSHSRILRFRRQSTFWHPRWFIPPLQGLQRRHGARMALVSEVTIQGRTLVLYNAHLESRGNDELRRDQLSEMLLDAEGNSGMAPAIVAGDFNFDISRGPAATLIAGTQLDSPFARLGRRNTTRNCRCARGAAIDWILTDTALSATGPEIDGSVSASDHYPLTLEVRMNGDGFWD